MNISCNFIINITRYWYNKSILSIEMLNIQYFGSEILLITPFLQVNFIFLKICWCKSFDKYHVCEKAQTAKFTVLQGEISSTVLKTWKTRKTKMWITQFFKYYTISRVVPCERARPQLFFLTSLIFRDKHTFAALCWLWAAITPVKKIVRPKSTTFSETSGRELSHGPILEKFSH